MRFRGLRYPRRFLQSSRLRGGAAGTSACLSGSDSSSTLGLLAQIAFGDGMRVVSANSFHVAALDFDLDTAIAEHSMQAVGTHSTVRCDGTHCVPSWWFITSRLSSSPHRGTTLESGPIAFGLSLRAIALPRRRTELRETAHARGRFRAVWQERIDLIDKLQNWCS